jgi:hypothetical protein
MLLLTLLLAASHQTESPAQFINRVYREYRQANFSPLEKPERFFSPELTAAIKNDGSSGEVGYLDGDPLCDCQDYERVDARVRAIRQPTARSADARVHVTLDPRTKRDLRLKLVLTRAGWRIADVIESDGGSLLRELKREALKRGAHRN